jgi:hypothetical protein
MSYTDRPSDEFISLLRQSGDSDLNVAQAAQELWQILAELLVRHLDRYRQIGEVAK